VGLGPLADFAHRGGLTALLGKDLSGNVQKASLGILDLGHASNSGLEPMYKTYVLFYYIKQLF
jgi:hypothetical protein